MKVQSTINRDCYDTEECVYILNMLQVWKYLMNDAKVLDVLPGESGKIIFVFSKEDTGNLYRLWCKREL